MNNRVIKISAVILIFIVLVQFFLNVRLFYKEYKNLNELQVFNQLSAIISELLHKTQQERGAASGFIGSNGTKFREIYYNTILSTDKEIKLYFDFIKEHNCKINDMKYNINIINNYIKELKIIREKIKNLDISLIDELKFYTSMNSNLLSIMDKLVILTHNEKLVKGLSAYANFTKAKEKVGIERAVLTGVFSINKWDKILYIKFITLLAEQKTYLNMFTSMSSQEIRKFYNNIRSDITFIKVKEMENIALLKDKDFGINPIIWYETITKKINLLNKVNKEIYQYNTEVIQHLRKKLIISILISLTISALIVFFVIYTLFLLKKENELLLNKAIYDQLTGLYNRMFFISEFKIEKARADRNKTKIAVMFIDLDGFKDINDSLGHEIGDKVLVEIAKRIVSHVRKSDVVARFGGDEFLIMLTDIKEKHIEKISEIADKILKDIKRPIIINDIENRVSASIGISIYPDDGRDIQTLIKNADMSMYKSKNAGKDRITFYEDEMSEESNIRLKLKNDIYKVLRKNQLELFYQPQIDKDNNLVGMEVLLRWKHPELGLLSPVEFLPLAIEIGFIEEIDLWVMENALKQIKEWQDKNYNIGIVSCNLTIYQLEKGNLVTHLKEILVKTGVDASSFGLEITEEGIMQNPRKNIEILKQLKQLNITLSIDDFGTGYSSFEYLKKLPVDKLKIDSAFIKDLPDDEDDRVISSVIISLAKQLHLGVVAEGVETIAQRNFLFEQGCDAIQGYFYSEPLLAQDLEQEFLKK